MVPNKKHAPGNSGGWMDGCKSHFTDCLQQLKIGVFYGQHNHKNYGPNTPKLLTCIIFKTALVLIIEKK